jgi:cysteine desulfurase/selenocysteine lyase
MVTCEESRKYFPHIKTGLKYFNHASVGPISSIVKEKIDTYVSDRSEGIVENYFETIPQVKSAKERLSRLLNANIDEIAWIDNVSNALNVLANGIIWNHGDQIILNDLEFPSNVYPFLNLQKQGVEILFARSENGVIDLAQIEKLVSNKTKLISISLVQFLTGYKANIKAIGDFCRERNILFSVDGIQGAGVVQIDVKDCSVDFFTGGSQKWLMGLQGLSYFYISQNLLNKLEQKFVGWTSVKNAWSLLEYDLSLIDSAERFQNGTNSRIGIIALDASLSLFEEIGYSKIEDQILNNSQYLMKRLEEIGFELVLKDVQRQNLAGIITFKHKAADKIFNELKRTNIILSLREGMIRISPHFYNNEEDLDLLIVALNSLK